MAATSEIAVAIVQTGILLLGIYKARGRDDERIENVREELKEHKDLPVTRAHPAS